MPRISAYRRRSRSASAARARGTSRASSASANPDVGGIDYRLITPDFVTYDKDIKSTPLFGVGFGYDTGHYFRFDLTGEYRGDALFVFHDKYPGPTDLSVAIEVAGTNEYTADIESWLGLVNAYIDLGTWWCITPYVGGGVGFASLSITGYKDVNVPNGRRRLRPEQQRDQFRLGGLCRPVLQGESVAHHRSRPTATPISAISGRATSPRMTFRQTSGGFQIEDITSNDLMLSVRMALGSQPAPMPVAFK